MKSTLTHTQLRERLHYDQATGVFVWRINCGTANAGDVAGCVKTSQGYRLIGVLGRLYRAHRLAWLFVHGEFPSEYIDHINGNRDDNCLSNLRLATNSENLRNAKKHITNTSGVKGVEWCKRQRRWRARIRTNRGRICLGHFLSIEDAASAVRSAREEHHGAFCRHA